MLRILEIPTIETDIIFQYIKKQFFRSFNFSELLEFCQGGILMMNIIIVSPYSPKWSNIASIRWEKFSKYLSSKYKVSLITSAFKEPIKERTFDIGKADLVEIPLRFCGKNPFLADSKIPQETSTQHKIKGEVRFLLEKLFPMSSGGILYHDLKAHKNEIEKRLSTVEKNVLITTYDPWFSLKLGNWFKKKYKNLIWIADFRDPSFNLKACFFSKIPIFKAMTANILRRSDLITVVSLKMKEDFERIINNKNIICLPNGYDGELSGLYSTGSFKEKNSLSITYTGSLHPKSGEISFFVEALKQAKMRSPDTKFVFKYAGFHSTRVQSEFKRRDMKDILEDFGLVKRDEALRLQRETDILLLIAYTGDNEEEGKGIRTGKVYEYLASGKPILAIASQNWEMKDEIECDGVSKVFHKSQISEMAEYLIELSQRENLKLDLEARKKIIEKYLYRNLANELEETILNIKV